MWWQAEVKLPRINFLVSVKTQVEKWAALQLGRGSGDDLTGVKRGSVLSLMIGLFL